MGDDVEALTEGRVVRFAEEEDPKQDLAMEKELPPFYKLWIRGMVIHWRFWALLIWPPLCSFVFLIETTLEYRCLFVTLLMAGYWVMKVMPLGVTGLIPIALFPLLGILGTLETCKAYISDSNTMFIAALALAFSIEATNLHKRIALRILLVVGTTHMRLFFGITVVTLFISMWSGNTATTALMSPVAMEVLKQLEEEGLANVFEREGTLYEPPKPSRTTTCYLLGIAYASTIGGTGTLVGAGSNLTFKGIFELEFPKGPTIDFADWMIAVLPLTILMSLLVWSFLSWKYLGLLRNKGMDRPVLEQKDREKRNKATRVARDGLVSKYISLGHIKWAEIVVAVIFLGIICLWLTMHPTWTSGWAALISNKTISAATPAVLGMIILFMIPSSLSIFCCLSKDPQKRPDKPIDPILVWSYVNYKMLWSSFLLLGGGIALAKGFEKSGLAIKLSHSLSGLNALPPFVVLLIVCFVSTNFTEFTSNSAVVTLFLPLVAQMAVVLRINPIYLMLPTTLCCQFSFMLPVGTPPNAIVAGYGHIRFKDMVITGIAPSIITYLVVVGIFPFWGSLVYHLRGFPEWAEEGKGNRPT